MTSGSVGSSARCVDDAVGRRLNSRHAAAYRSSRSPSSSEVTARRLAAATLSTDLRRARRPLGADRLVARRRARPPAGRRSRAACDGSRSPTGRPADWDVAVEVTFSEYGERGSVDVLGARREFARDGRRRGEVGPHRRSEATLRKADEKERIVRGSLGRSRFGFKPRCVASSRSSCPRPRRRAATSARSRRSFVPPIPSRGRGRSELAPTARR